MRIRVLVDSGWTQRPTSTKLTILSSSTSEPIMPNVFRLLSPHRLPRSQLALLRRPGQISLNAVDWHGLLDILLVHRHPVQLPTAFGAHDCDEKRRNSEKHGAELERPHVDSGPYECVTGVRIVVLENSETHCPQLSGTDDCEKLMEMHDFILGRQDLCLKPGNLST
jgi:hypothetical protein